MTDDASPRTLFDELRDLVQFASLNGIPAHCITLGAVRTLQWGKETAFQHNMIGFTPNGPCCEVATFCGIPVVLNSETPGITVG